MRHYLVISVSATFHLKAYSDVGKLAPNEFLSAVCGHNDQDPTDCNLTATHNSAIRSRSYCELNAIALMTGHNEFLSTGCGRNDRNLSDCNRTAIHSSAVCNRSYCELTAIHNSEHISPLLCVLLHCTQFRPALPI